MGLFISVEGPDGSGKSLQMRLLEQSLREMDLPLVCTREPGGTEISERIRELLLDPKNRRLCARSEALLYAASRAQLVDEVIRPALEAGNIVLSDRFIDSSLVYQGIGRELGVDNVFGINRFAIADTLPDVTILIQIDFEEGLRRKAAQRGGVLDRMEQQADSFHQKVHDGFNNLAQFDPKRVVVVDGAQTPEKVHADILEALKPYLQDYI